GRGVAGLSRSECSPRPRSLAGPAMLCRGVEEPQWVSGCCSWPKDRSAEGSAGRTVHDRDLPGEVTVGQPQRSIGPGPGDGVVSARVRLPGSGTEPVGAVSADSVEEVGALLQVRRPFA